VIGSTAPDTALTTFLGRALVVFGALLAACAPTFAGGINGLTIAGARALAARRSAR
jgi:hypothetical protein